MNETDPRDAERSFYDDTDYADVDLELAEDVQVVRQPAPRSTFALRLDGSTIERLRELARRRGRRPTQLAREWLIERLEREQQGAGEDRFEGRLADLERAFVRLTGSYSRGTKLFPSKDADLVAELEARAMVARELWQRLDIAATVEASADAGADLLVRHGERTWVIEIKSRTADLIPSFQHVLTLAAQLNARPVLVSPQLPSKDVEALSRASGVFVARPDKLDDLLAEIASAG
jgi:predicted transcriptional regulator